MFDNVVALKPAISAMTTYRPVGSAGMVYSPLESDLTVRVRPVPSFVAVTLAFEITDPVTSVTVPRMVPLTDCAPAPEGRAIARSSRTRTSTRVTGAPARLIMCVLQRRIDGDLRGFGKDGSLYRPRSVVYH